MEKKIKRPPYLNDYSSKEAIFEGIACYNEKENTKLSNNLYEYLIHIDELCDNFSYDSCRKIAKFYGERLSLSIDEFDIRTGSNNVVMSAYLEDCYRTITSSHYAQLMSYNMVEFVDSFLAQSSYVEKIAEELRIELNCNITINEDKDSRVYKGHWSLHIWFDNIVDRNIYIHIPFKPQKAIPTIQVDVTHDVAEGTSKWGCECTCNFTCIDIIEAIQSLYRSKLNFHRYCSGIKSYIAEMARFADYGYHSLESMIELQLDLINVTLYEKIENAISSMKKYLYKTNDFVAALRSEMDGYVFYSGNYDKFIILSNIAIVRGDKRKYSKAVESGLFAHVAIFSGDYKKLYRSETKINLCKTKDFKAIVDQFL